jgi:hypothetical protein
MHGKAITVWVLKNAKIQFQIPCTLGLWLLCKWRCICTCIPAIMTPCVQHTQKGDCSHVMILVSLCKAITVWVWYPSLDLQMQSQSEYWLVCIPSLAKQSQSECIVSMYTFTCIAITVWVCWTDGIEMAGIQTFTCKAITVWGIVNLRRMEQEAVFCPSYCDCFASKGMHTSEYNFMHTTHSDCNCFRIEQMDTIH